MRSVAQRSVAAVFLAVMTAACSGGTNNQAPGPAPSPADGSVLPFPSHLGVELLKSLAGIDVVHVPFNGNGPANTATMGGQVQVLFGSMPAVLPQAKAGRVRPLAVGTPKRSPALPEVPTVSESGYPGFDASLWLGFFAPKGTPAPILKRLYTELVAVATSPEMKEQFERNGAEPLVSSSPAELTKLMQTEIERYRKVIKAAGVQLD